MSNFEQIGNPDPFLKVTLNKNETVFSESGSIVMCSDGVSFTGKAKGGVVSSLFRKVTTGESFFQIKINSQINGGEVLLSPACPGGIEIIDLKENGYMVSDGSFLACEESINLNTKIQKLSGALFGKSGGLFVLHCSGLGKVAVSGLGGLHAINLKDEKKTIDNGHVVAWEDSLDYKIGLPEGGGLIKKAVGAATTGEGIVLNFSGTGRVIVSSRNRSSFFDWIGSRLPSK